MHTKDDEEFLIMWKASSELNGPVWEKALKYLSRKNILLILEMVKDKEARLFYLREAFTFGWSREELIWQINSDLSGRAGRMLTNFEGKLAPGLWETARQSLNAPADFHLSLTHPINSEWDLTEALADDITAFLTGLGKGFSYQREQFRLRDCRLDFLLYHSEFNCHVIVEMKMTKFKAEYIGKMNRYLEEADLLFEHERKNNCIGLIYCTDLDDQHVISALKNSNKPIGVAAYLVDGRSPRAA
jgi:predicted nuclease of restriction endonuclease-like (RecB) superfamily